MPYNPTTWVSGGAPGIDAPQLNNLESQYTEATNSFGQDLFTAFVLTGYTASKDGTTASQLDVTSGVAYVKQSDNTLRRRASGALNYSTTGHASTTMYLDLNPDGSWSWGTAHSAVTNHLTICTVTTDASANISAVTDTRTLTTTFMGATSGPMTIGSTTDAGPQLEVIATQFPLQGRLGSAPASDTSVITADVFGDAGTRLNLYIRGADGYAGVRAGKGSGFTAMMYAQATGWKMDNSTLLLTQPGSTSAATNFMLIQNTTNAAAQYNFYIGTDGSLGVWDANNSKAVFQATGLNFNVSGNYSGGAGCGIPTTRNGAAVSAPVYTGTTNPVNPPTGSVWAKA